MNFDKIIDVQTKHRQKRLDFVKRDVNGKVVDVYSLNSSLINTKTLDDKRSTGTYTNCLSSVGDIKEDRIVLVSNPFNYTEAEIKRYLKGMKLLFVSLRGTVEFFKIDKEGIKFKVYFSKSTHNRERLFFIYPIRILHSAWAVDYVRKFLKIKDLGFSYNDAFYLATLSIESNMGFYYDPYYILSYSKINKEKIVYVIFSLFTGSHYYFQHVSLNISRINQLDNLYTHLIKGEYKEALKEYKKISKRYSLLSKNYKEGSKENKIIIEDTKNYTRRYEISTRDLGKHLFGNEKVTDGNINRYFNTIGVSYNTCVKGYSFHKSRLIPKLNKKDNCVDFFIENNEGKLLKIKPS